MSKAITGGESRKLGAAEQVGAGFVGGALSGVICAPMELVMIQQQRSGGSLLGTAGRVLRDHGVGALFRGAPRSRTSKAAAPCARRGNPTHHQRRLRSCAREAAALCTATLCTAKLSALLGLATSCGREGLFTAGDLGLAPVLADQIHQEFGVGGKLGSFLGACCAGMLAATLSHPLDTIKTCLQGDVAQEKYKSMPETYRALMKEGGTGRFFTGWSWRTGRMICAIFVMGQCKDRLAPFFYPHHFKQQQQRAWSTPQVR